jgi:predicted RNA-binding Zn-ribbon protein involved in translation (DUF1610 family)
MVVILCGDCESPIELGEDASEGDIFVCPSCGAEYEYKDGELKILELSGEDWGE